MEILVYRKGDSKIEEFQNYLYFIVHGVTADTTPERFNAIVWTTA